MEKGAEGNPLIKGALFPVNGQVEPHKFAAFDVETVISDSGDHVFMCGSIWDGEGHMFWSRIDMLKALMSKRYRNHNLFATSLDFDFFTMFKADYALYDMEFCFRGSSLIMADVNDENGNMTRKFLDTMNFYPVGVDVLGKCIGMRKMQRPRSWLRMPADDDERHEMEAYNINDSRITYEWVKWFQGRLNSIGCNMRNTIASTSLWNWRRHYQDMPLYQPKADIMLDMLQAYYGGRTECFARGTYPGKRCYLYDVNAMYCWAMTNEFPLTHTIFESKNPTGDDILDYHGVTLCDVEAPSGQNYPFLPYRRDDGRLIFPIGRWKSRWYSNIELRRAMELGYSVTPRKGWYYTGSYMPFKALQEDYFSKRKTQPELQLVYKLLSNSLYGKFGQRWEDETVYVHMSQFKNMPREYLDIRNEFVLMKKHNEPRSFVNPIFSLYTSAYSRILIHRLISCNNAMYCDTDSIITEKVLPDSGRLGELKLEKTLNKLMLLRPKVYFMNDDISGDKVKAKGFRLRTKEELDFMLNNGYFPQLHIRKFKESLRLNVKTLTQLTIKKHLDLNDTKRRWPRKFDPLGWDISEPLEVQ